MRSGQDIDVVSSFARCLAVLLDIPVADVPQQDAEWGDWTGQLRQWLARRHLGLVRLASATTFEWPGYWIAVAKLNDSPRDAAVLMFGSPSGAKPRVMVPGKVVETSLSPTAAGRDMT